MTAPEHLLALIERAVSVRGIERIRSVLMSIIDEGEVETLTIVANEGRHLIPETFLRGELFIASRGNLDFSSPSSAKSAYIEIIKKLNKKLLERSWKRIYLIPTGHPTLPLQLKAEVYRVTRINTIDLFYLTGTYFDLDIDLRQIEETK